VTVSNPSNEADYDEVANEFIETENFELQDHLITRILESNLIIGIDNPLLSSIVKFGSVFNLATIVYVALNYKSTSPSFMIAWLLGLVWFNVAPALVWYYDKRVVPQFFYQISNTVVDRRNIIDLSKKYNRIFCRKYWIPAIPWTVAIVLAFSESTDFLREQGLFDLGLALYVLFAIYFILIGVLFGIGFTGAVTTILLSRNVALLDFTIDPLHPDERGGLGSVGYYTTQTTLLLSLESIWLPLAFLVATGSSVETLATLIVGTYIACISLTFLYPTWIINKKAIILCESILKDLQQEHKQVEKQVSTESNEELSYLNRQLELQRIRKRYEDYRQVRLYPINIGILVRFAGSILLPLGFLMLDIYISNLA